MQGHCKFDLYLSDIEVMVHN